MKRSLIRLGLAALVSTALFGCGGGGDGVNATSTITVPLGPTTTASTVVSNASTPTTQSVQAWRALQPTITVTGVSINSPPVVRFAVTDANGAGVVGLGNTSHSSTARGDDVANGLKAVNALTNLRFTLAKLVPATATAPSKWVSYLVLKPTTEALYKDTASVADKAKESCTADRLWCGTYPTTDSEGTLVDYGNGTYQYTFFRDITKAKAIVDTLVDSTNKFKADLGDVTYDPSLTHRVGIQISGAAPGTGTNVPTATQVIAGVNIAIPTNIYYDFRPDGQTVSSTRNVVDVASCDSCHNGKGLAHGGGRKDPNFCVTCHTDQVKYGMSTNYVPTGLALPTASDGNISVLDSRAIADFPNFAHKIHMGSELKLTGYAYKPGSGAAMTFTDVEWIQDPRNCTKCHSGVDKTDINQATKTKDGDNWKTKPSRLACGACHDNVNFATGVITTATGTSNHTAGPAADDSTCSTCHTSAVIAESHRTEAPTANNSTQIDGVSSIAYEIKTVALNASRQPQITFRIKKDGSYLSTAFPAATTAVTSGAVGVASSFEPIPGFKSGPTFYIAYAVPQDGVASPADFNTYQSANLGSLLVSSGSPKAGSITGPDADGYFVATLTGDTLGQVVTGSCTQKATTETGYCVNRSPIKVPTGAKMVTGAMIGNFTQLAFASGTKAATTYGTSYATGLVIKTPLQQKLASGISGNAARRVVVDTNKCEACHEQLGTAVDFHGGARNDATSCAICHNPNRTSGGWAANASTFVHGIHAGTDSASVTAATTIGTSVVGVPGSGRGGAGTGYSVGKRSVPFSWHRDKTPGTAGGFNAAQVVYPGILKTCDNCHVPNAVNFGLSGSSLLPNLLWSTAGTGKYNGSTDLNKVYPRNVLSGDSTKNYVTYITADNVVNYGNVFSFTPEGSVVPKITTAAGANNSNALTIAGAGGVTITADTATLVESPITSACFSCHDTSVAKSHMSQYGGVMYGSRAASGGATLVNNETCLICHGYGRAQDAAVVHAK